MYLITHATGERYRHAADCAERVHEYLRQKGQDVSLVTAGPDRTIQPKLVLAVGGDGTIMRTMKEHAAPVFGINAGSIGFLSGAEADHQSWQPAIDRLLRGDFVIEERLALHALITRAREPNRAVGIQPIANEIAIQHDEYPFHCLVSVNREPMWDELFSRGVMVATATGSPAWNFSSGGPLLFPESRDVALTPINPQFASQRPFTLPQLAAGGSIEIEVRPQKNLGSTMQLVLDGERQEPLGFGDTVKISLSPERLRLATFGLPQFFDALRKKGIATGSRPHR